MSTEAYDRRKAADRPTWRVSSLVYIALAGSLGVAGASAAFFLYKTIPWIMLPADILMWAESGFLGDLIKLQQGVPFYLPPEASNSPIYTPGAPGLAYVVLKVLGIAISAPAVRVLQLVIVGIASALAFQNVIYLRRICNSGARNLPLKYLAAVLAMLLLFLAATAPEVNKYVWMMHTDGTALLATMVFWWALLKHVRRPTGRSLLILATMPAVGFAIKPLLLAWLPVTIIVILFLPADGLSIRLRSASIYGTIAAVVVLFVIGVFYLWWGENFWFWVFDVMGGSRKQISLSGEFNISLLRSVDHFFRAWWEIGLGCVGGWMLLRRDRSPAVMALFAGWVTLVLMETVVSGNGWHTLYHFGPAVLIGMTWLLAALPEAVGLAGMTATSDARSALWTAGMTIVATFSICIALRVLPSRDGNADRWFPGVRPPQELYSQIEAIESEFEEYRSEEVLLDVGNWIYLGSGYVAQDRAISLGDQPMAGIYDNFQPLLERIRKRYYKKILVRDFHGPTFLYDYGLWEKSSGVRSALLANYDEVSTIPEVKEIPVMFAGPVSVLVPKVSDVSGENGVDGDLPD